VENFSLPNSKAYLNSVVVALFIVDRHNEWNRIQSPDLKPYIYGPLIFNRGAEAIQQGSFSNNMVLFEQCTAMLALVAKYRSYPNTKVKKHGGSLPLW
jgi:hypothetical protein